MKSYLWDTGALSQLFAKHHKAVSMMIKMINQETLGFVPTIVFAEFYYKTWQNFGEKAAQLRIINLKEIGIQESQPQSYLEVAMTTLKKEVSID